MQDFFQIRFTDDDLQLLPTTIEALHDRRPEGYTDAQPPKLPGAPEPAPADPKK